MAMQQTSLLAWKQVRNQLGDRQVRVMAVIRKNPGISNQEIAEKLRWPINCVTPRVKELREKGRVREAGDKYAVTGRKVKTWEKTDDE